MISANDLELLIQALKDESIEGEDRRKAAEVLGKIKDPKDLTTLIQYFKDTTHIISINEAWFEHWMSSFKTDLLPRRRS